MKHSIKATFVTVAIVALLSGSACALREYREDDDFDATFAMNRA